MIFDFEGPRECTARLNNGRATESVYWSPRYNSYVLVNNPSGEWETERGERVSLWSINGIGECRWSVEPWRVERVRPDEIGDHGILTDSEEMYLAVRHFDISPV